MNTSKSLSSPLLQNYKPSQILSTLKDYSITFVILSYIILGWSVLYIRVPPVGFGLTIDIIFLIFFFLTTNINNLLNRMNRVFPMILFILFWIYSFSRIFQGFIETDYWAFRDGTPVINSLYILVGFYFFYSKNRLLLLKRHGTKLIIIFFIYLLLGFIFQDYSPIIESGTESQAAVTLLFSLSLSPYIVLISSLLPIIRSKFSTLTHYVFCVISASFLISLLLIPGQARTLYIFILEILLLIVLFFRQATFTYILCVLIPILIVFLIGISPLDIRGRLGERIDIMFLYEHFLAIFGVKGSGAVAGAAAGVDQRFDWWLAAFTKMRLSLLNLFFGLGYGDKLVSFGVVREPHNSYLSQLFRGGIMGFSFFVILHTCLITIGIKLLNYYNKYKYSYTNKLIIFSGLLILFIYNYAIAEDALEKPFFCIPLYFTWGGILALAYHHKYTNVLTEAEKS